MGCLVLDSHCLEPIGFPRSEWQIFALAITHRTSSRYFLGMGGSIGPRACVRIGCATMPVGSSENAVSTRVQRPHSNKRPQIYRAVQLDLA